MLLLVLALFWVALLAPVAIRRFRDGGGEKSIQSLSRRARGPEPPGLRGRPRLIVLISLMRRLFKHRPTARRPHLRVVHSDDTVHTLDARSTWDEWARTTTTTKATPTGNHSERVSRPTEPESLRARRTPLTAETNRRCSEHYARRLRDRPITVRAASPPSMTQLLFARRPTLRDDGDRVRLGCVNRHRPRRPGMVCVVLFVALALYAVSQGYLSEPTLNAAPAPASPVTLASSPYTDVTTRRRQRVLTTTTELAIRVLRAPSPTRSWQREPSAAAPWAKVDTSSGV